MSSSNDLISDVRQGMDVYCSDGEKVGTVADVNIGTVTGAPTITTATEERSYFRVERGGFLGIGGEDFYVPAEVVQQVGDDRVTLGCASGELESVVFTGPPPESTAGGDDADAAGSLGIARGPNSASGTGYGNQF
jgi:sporulation protein YlmC with PRC-barrel domain